MYTLTVSELMPGETLGQSSWGITISVVSNSPEDYPPEVFVYQLEDPGNVASRLYYTAIATPSQLLEYPTDEPAILESGQLVQPYLRSKELTLVARNPTYILEMVEDVVNQITLLRDNLDALAEMGATTTITI